MASRRILVGAVVVLAIVNYLTLPPLAPTLPEASSARTPVVRGAVHVHTRLSDGTGTMDDVAAAAARAGLRFVVFTDHGDGMRAPERAAYRRGVLCLDGVEISTDGGHLVGLGLPRAPYPLRGEPRDVAEDVRRLGGVAIAAHPGSAKPDLQWRDWNAQVNGLEWLNVDSEWRDEKIWSLARALFAYPLRRPEAIATLLDRPDAVLRRWDELTARRRVIGLAATDAHARIGLTQVGEPYDGRASLPIPAYETLFRTLSLALVGVSFTGNAAADAVQVVDAVRAGHFFSQIDALAKGGAFAFTASSGDTERSAGDVLSVNGPVSLRVETESPAGAEIVLLRNGAPFRSAPGPRIEVTAPAGPAVYRAEVRLPGGPGEPPVPWIVSNPIYVGRSMFGEADTTAPSSPVSPTPLPDEERGARAVVEKSATTAGSVDVIAAVSGTQLLFRYALGGRASASPYVAAVVPAPAGTADYRALMFTARASQPMRLSVQLRASGNNAEERWARSIYVDEVPRSIAVSFDDMRARGAMSSSRPNLTGVDSILFVVDTVNTPVGASGQIWLDDLALGR